MTKIGPVLEREDRLLLNFPLACLLEIIVMNLATLYNNWLNTGGMPEIHATAKKHFFI